MGDRARVAEQKGQPVAALSGYGVAIGLIAMAVTWLFFPVFGVSSSTVFYIVVIVAAWRRGLGPAILLSGVSEAAIHQFVEVTDALRDTQPGDPTVWRHADLLGSPYPRPYQYEAYAVFRRRGYQGTLIESPTGSGKTMFGTMCIQDWLRSLRPGQSILVLVPTRNYQQQWIGELCYKPIGLRLAPEDVFSGTPMQLERSLQEFCHELVGLIYLTETVDQLTQPGFAPQIDVAGLSQLSRLRTELRRQIEAEGLTALSDEQRTSLAIDLMKTHNKVTRIHELVKAFGSTRQVTYRRRQKLWRRKPPVAAKQAHEVCVQPFGEEKVAGEAHAPLLYVEDPRLELPFALPARVAEVIDGRDELIVEGWMVKEEPAE